ncbi:hypothetical protein MRX96_036622 [Rhipicephalus microplus]
MPFLMQVVLLGFISTTSCVFRLPESPPGLPPAYLTNKPPLLFTDENDECQAEPDSATFSRRPLHRLATSDIY